MSLWLVAFGDGDQQHPVRVRQARQTEARLVQRHAGQDAALAQALADHPSRAAETQRKLVERRP